MAFYVKFAIIINTDLPVTLANLYFICRFHFQKKKVMYTETIRPLCMFENTTKIDNK